MLLCPLHLQKKGEKKGGGEREKKRKERVALLDLGPARLTRKKKKREEKEKKRKKGKKKYARSGCSRWCNGLLSCYESFFPFPFNFSAIGDLFGGKKRKRKRKKTQKLYGWLSRYSIAAGAHPPHLTAFKLTVILNHVYLIIKEIYHLFIAPR